MHCGSCREPLPLMASTSTIELNRLRRPPPLQNPAYFTEEHSPPVSPSNFVAQNAEEEDALNIQPPWKRSLYQLLEQPTSSSRSIRLPYVQHISNHLIRNNNCSRNCTSRSFDIHRIWFGLETSIVALFTMEYGARCVAWSNTWSSLLYWTFCKSPNDLGFNAD
jgi:potassium voltage-gated channel Shal-related subfamily D protein 2